MALPGVLSGSAEQQRYLVLGSLGEGSFSSVVKVLRVDPIEASGGGTAAAKPPHLCTPSSGSHCQQDSIDERSTATPMSACQHAPCSSGSSGSNGSSCCWSTPESAAAVLQSQDPPTPPCGTVISWHAPGRVPVQVCSTGRVSALKLPGTLDFRTADGYKEGFCDHAVEFLMLRKVACPYVAAAQQLLEVQLPVFFDDDEDGCGSNGWLPVLGFTMELVDGSLADLAKARQQHGMRAGVSIQAQWAITRQLILGLACAQIKGLLHGWACHQCCVRLVHPYGTVACLQGAESCRPWGQAPYVTPYASAVHACPYVLCALLTAATPVCCAAFAATSSQATWV